MQSLDVAIPAVPSNGVPGTGPRHQGTRGVHGRGAKVARGLKLPPAQVSADKIVKAFNTWSFKREQPSDAARLEGVVARALEAGEPIPFVLYWGKGPRDSLGRPDELCLDYLKSLADRVRDAYAPGAAIRLILTDTHARLNGHPGAAVERYFAAVTAAAAERGFSATRLSHVVEEASALADLDDREAPSGEVLKSLVACAAKWYRGEGSTEDGALAYHRMNMVEKRAIEVAFPEAVFVTFNGSEFRDLFPASLPVFYMYSLRRGFGVKPWFMAADAGAPEAAPAAPTAPSTATPQ